MSGSKVEVVVGNWFPRFLANGLDYLDVRRTLDEVREWDDWAPAWTATAGRYEELGREALDDGHRVTAAEHLRRAALTLQFAQFVLTEDPEHRRTLQRRMQSLYATAAPLLDPPAISARVPFDGGTVVGYLRVPPGPPRPGLAVLVPGLESTKEQFSTYEPFFLRRGVATLSIEGPGQGECGLELPFRSEAYERAARAVAAYVAGLSDVDGERVVVVGTSFGGYLALRYGLVFGGLRGVVDIAGFYDLTEFDDLQTVTQSSFAEFVHVESVEEARTILRDVTLTGSLRLLQAPVLVVHGEQDRITPVSHARRIADELGARAHLHVEPEGGHSCNDLHTVIRPVVADWTADRLGVETG